MTELQDMTELQMIEEELQMIEEQMTEVQL